MAPGRSIVPLESKIRAADVSPPNLTTSEALRIPAEAISAFTRVFDALWA